MFYLYVVVFVPLSVCHQIIYIVNLITASTESHPFSKAKNKQISSFLGKWGAVAITKSMAVNESSTHRVNIWVFLVILLIVNPLSQLFCRII